MNASTRLSKPPAGVWLQDCSGATIFDIHTIEPEFGPLPGNMSQSSLEFMGLICDRELTNAECLREFFRDRLGKHNPFIDLGSSTTRWPRGREVQRWVSGPTKPLSFLRHPHGFSGQKKQLLATSLICLPNVHTKDKSSQTLTNEMTLNKSQTRSHPSHLFCQMRGLTGPMCVPFLLSLELLTAGRTPLSDTTQVKTNKRTLKCSSDMVAPRPPCSAC